MHQRGPKLPCQASLQLYVAGEVIKNVEPHNTYMYKFEETYVFPNESE